MKTARKITAILLCAVMAALLFTACHKKDEIAVTIGDYKFTAGYYACALVYADTEARRKVSEEFEEAGKDTEDIDYMKQKVEGEEFEKWVKNKAIDILKETAGYMALCKENKFELSDSEKQTAENYVKNYWDSYGYSEMFVNNGVSRETFLKFSTESYYAQVYFDHVYGAEGTNPVSEEDIKKALEENFVLANKLEISKTDGTEEEIAERTEMAKTYLERLNNGTPFSEVYVAYDELLGNSPRDISEGDGETTPKDPNAELLGDKDSDYASDYYEEIRDMAVGENKIIENDDVIVLVHKLDIMEDGYYLKAYDDTLRSKVVGDEADEAARKKADELGVKQDAYVVDLFKVKNLTYPESITIGGR